MTSWFAIYVDKYKTKTLLMPAKVFLQSHRLPGESSRSFEREAKSAVKRVCFYLHELMLLRAEMDQYAKKRKTRDVIANLQDISFDIHRVGHKIELAVLDAYDTLGISWTSTSKLPVRTQLQSPYRGLIDMIEQEKMRATYHVVKSHEHLYVPCTQLHDGTDAAKNNYATVFRIDILQRMARLDKENGRV